MKKIIILLAFIVLSNHVINTSEIAYLRRKPQNKCLIVFKTLSRMELVSESLEDVTRLVIEAQKKSK